MRAVESSNHWPKGLHLKLLPVCWIFNQIDARFDILAELAPPGGKVRSTQFAIEVDSPHQRVENARPINASVSLTKSWPIFTLI